MLKMAILDNQSNNRRDYKEQQRRPGSQLLCEKDCEGDFRERKEPEKRYSDVFFHHDPLVVRKEAAQTASLGQTELRRTGMPVRL